MTNKELEHRCYDAIDDLLSIGIDLTTNHYIFRINGRLTRVCGRCTRKTNQPYNFTIEFNPAYIDAVEVDELYDTIIHELLHSAPNCFNHGEEWQRLAGIANKNLLTNVTRLYRGADYQPWKYYVVCDDCGCKMDYRVRRTQSWINIANGNSAKYYCPKCHSYHLIAKEF